VLVVLLNVSSAPDGPGSSSSTVLVFQGPSVTYSRPDTLSDVFAPVEGGDSVQACARTSSGWTGFDPGTAQAGNAGSFRYRWIPPGTRFTTEVDTSLLPVVWAPEAGVTYAQSFYPVEVHSLPDIMSPVTGTMPQTSAAAIVFRTGEWYLVDLARGPAPRSCVGWISAVEVSVSGDLEKVARRGIWRAFLSVLTE